MNRRPRTAPLTTIQAMPSVETVKTLIGDQAPELDRITREQVVAVVRSPAFAAQIRDLVRAAALEIAREILAELMPDLEGRVRAIVAENFEKSVVTTAHALLDEKLAEIRRKLA